MGDWHVYIENSKDVGSSWSVSAKASDLANTKDPTKLLNGNMIFKRSPNEVVNMKNDTFIASHTKMMDEKDTPYDIVKYWKPDDGILLHLGPNNPSGMYSGIISWTLIDATPNV